MRRLTLANRLEELDHLREFLEGLARDRLIPERELNPINLVLEELVTNAIQYGLEGQSDRTIQIDVECSEARIEIEMRDDGRPFDPRNVPTPDLQSSLEERPIGGLGIHLVRSLTEELEYERVEGHNVIRVVRLVS